MPLGIYDHEDDTPGVTSYELPSGIVSKVLYDGTRFLERLDDIAGAGLRLFQLPERAP